MRKPVGISTGFLLAIFCIKTPEIGYFLLHLRIDTNTAMKTLLARVFAMYRDGFRNMTLGQTLWLVIAVKLAIIFLVVKLLFFPDRLASDYDTDSERSQAVRDALVAEPQNDDFNKHILTNLQNNE